MAPLPNLSKLCFANFTGRLLNGAQVVCGELNALTSHGFMLNYANGSLKCCERDVMIQPSIPIPTYFDSGYTGAICFHFDACF